MLSTTRAKGRLPKPSRGPTRLNIGGGGSVAPSVRVRLRLKRFGQPPRAGDKVGHLIIDRVAGKHAVAIVSINKANGADAVAVRVMERQTLLGVGMKLRHDRSDVARALGLGSWKLNPFRATPFPRDFRTPPQSFEQ